MNTEKEIENIDRMDLNPKEFEKLLCEFCKQDLPSNFTVEHDVKEIGGESGNKRQIDTKIKGKLGVSEILICGEAKNWNSEVGSETIDGLVGKYLSGEIRANKVILFSNGGYSQPVIERAKKVGIELLQPLNIGRPIISVPHIVAVGYLGTTIVEVTHEGPQQTFLTANSDNYIILKGGDRISFNQFVYRLIIDSLHEIPKLNIFVEVSKLKLKDHNVLYELKGKEGYRYNGNFEIEVNLRWDFFVEDLAGSVLHHVNTGENLFVNLQGNAFEILGKVLMSNTKRNYEDRGQCIAIELNGVQNYSFNVCMPDPDQLSIDPGNPIFGFIQ